MSHRSQSASNADDDNLEHLLEDSDSAPTQLLRAPQPPRAADELLKAIDDYTMEEQHEYQRRKMEREIGVTPTKVVNVVRWQGGEPVPSDGECQHMQDEED